MKKSYNILLVGVGGQGILTMFKILGNAARKMGFNVNGAETHGMSQRGGSVYVHLRFSKNKHDKIYSPLVMKKQADLVVSLEPTEALRFAEYIKPDGIIITSINPVEPPNLPLTRKNYPDVKDVVSNLYYFTPNVVTIDFNKNLESLGLRSLNIAMIGALTQIQNFPILKPVLEEEIQEELKKIWEKAQPAYDIGRKVLPAKV